MAKLDVSRIKKLYWDEDCNAKEIAKNLKVSVWSLYNFMQRNNIPRRSYSDANYIVYKDKPKFKLKEKLTIEEQQLKIAGVMLYWAEGTLKNSTVDFANSDPRMVSLFMKFLRNVCGVNENRLRIYLYAYAYQDLSELKKYWSTVTKVPLSQFTRPYVRIGNADPNDRKLLYGLVHVRYNDTKLLGTIGNWIKEYIREFRGEVPEWPNGPDCVKRSVPKKFGMEKRVNSGKPLRQKP